LKLAFQKAMARPIWKKDKIGAIDYVQGESATTAIGSNDFEEAYQELHKGSEANFC